MHIRNWRTANDYQYNKQNSHGAIVAQTTDTTNDDFLLQGGDSALHRMRNDMDDYQLMGELDDLLAGRHVLVIIDGY